MILKIGSDFYNHLFYIQIRKKYSKKVSQNNFEVNEIFQKIHVENYCFLESLSSKSNADIIQYQLKELKKLKQSLQFKV